MSVESEQTNPTQDQSPVNEPANSTDQPQKPEYLEDKFWDAEAGQVRVEALAKSYGELQKKQSDPASEEKAKEQVTEHSKENQSETESENPQYDAAQDASKQLEAKGLDYEEFNNEFIANGELSQESLDKLKGAGFTEEQVKTHIAGLTALRDNRMGEIYELAGGEPMLRDAMDWASKAYSPADIQAFDTAMAQGTKEMQNMVVRDLMLRYSETNTMRPKVQLEGKPSFDGLAPFMSDSEYHAAIADPRYKTDARYRAKVDARLELGYK